MCPAGGPATKKGQRWASTQGFCLLHTHSTLALSSAFPGVNGVTLVLTCRIMVRTGEASLYRARWLPGTVMNNVGVSMRRPGSWTVVLEEGSERDT